MAIIVLTGGPCGGKSTVVNAIRREMGNNKRVVCMSEVATSLLNERQYDFTIESERVCFQEDVFNRQMEAEEMMIHPGRVLIVDRGLLDGSVYWPGGTDAWCKYFGVSRKFCYERYSEVIHLESLAIGAAYEQTSVRTEDRDGAAVLDGKIELVWRNHHKRYIFLAKQSIREKIDMLKSHINFALRTTTGFTSMGPSLDDFRQLIRQGLFPARAFGAC
jgi:predicted ATPase